MCADVHAHRRHRRSSSLRKPLSRLFRACARVHKSHDKTEARAIAESRSLRSRASVKFKYERERREGRRYNQRLALVASASSSVLSAVYGLLACFRIILIRWRRGRR